MITRLRKIQSPTLIFFSCVVVASVIVGFLSKPYFTEHIFYADNQKYLFDRKEEQQMIYRSRTADSIQVQVEQQKRTVFIDNQKYIITEINSKPNPTYSVLYPNGRKYEVQDQSRELRSFDEEGNIMTSVTFYVNNQRILSEDEEQYSPDTIVTAAYPVYHYTQGQPVYLFLALAGLIFGWCSFYYRNFQDLLFLLSLRWIWVNDPEPSDFYYLMTSIGGIVVMIGSVWIAFKAF
ncbi:hypothetical protein [Paenibacillus sp. ACRRY]|uniref:hypothetical protein n=1 Tax=Paenibacillus sp. ACRRY TaxID=2918208 RepID=UPI001EF531A1|nr:hypothetical protein [Paenibacillus sp. ACRRY]MCG7382983.1 hypothetical protein [Paenibacillus sp. ACRRY]